MTLSFASQGRTVPRNCSFSIEIPPTQQLILYPNLTNGNTFDWMRGGTGRTLAHTALFLDTFLSFQPENWSLILHPNSYSPHGEGHYRKLIGGEWAIGYWEPDNSIAGLKLGSDFGEGITRNSEAWRIDIGNFRVEVLNWMRIP